MKKLLNVLLALILGVSVFSALDLTASAASVPKVKSAQAYNIDEDEINEKTGKIIKWEKDRD